MNSIVVTGVSSGIGYSIAQRFIRGGFTVFGSVRSSSDAQRLQRELGEHFVSLQFDLTDETAIGTAAHWVKEKLQGNTLTALVNNAGIVVGGPLLEVTSDAFRHQLAVNVTGPFMVTKAFAPLLKVGAAAQGRPGRIVNMSSITGRLAIPFTGPYNASKAALDGFNDTLRRELRADGIDVVLIAPGPVSTPIMAKIKQSVARESSSYAGALRRYLKMSDGIAAAAMSPERVAQVVWNCVHASRPRTRYTVVPPGLMNFIQLTVTRYLPARLVDCLFAKALKLT